MGDLDSLGEWLSLGAHCRVDMWAGRAFDLGKEHHPSGGIYSSATRGNGEVA
jgi:hypothetical protein